jgi:ferredoxin
MPGTWRLAVDRDRCAGAGLCAATAPGHFQLQKGKSEPLIEDVDPAEVLLDVAALCPMEAITVHDETGVLLAPED